MLQSPLTSNDVLAFTAPLAVTIPPIRLTHACISARGSQALQVNATHWSDGLIRHFDFRDA